ncbi:MAG TPA: tetratricopeptide repeat protein [Kofleriaceae bacterium]|nr:tetratricopeptide repeat protein [Kofleriaceae bacterium]
MQSRSGELAMRPLPAVLLDLHEDIATGRLTLRRGRVSKSVDLVNGNPISTASSPRDETLGHFLVSSGVITEEQHKLGVQRSVSMGGKLGEALVAQGILTVEQLIEQLGKQARHKLVQALRWPQGAWRFEAGQQPVEGMQLRMLDVVLGGLRETAVEDLNRLARLDGMSFELTERGKRLRHELKKSFGERALAILSAGGPIAEIEKAMGDRAQARVNVDAMLMCDAIVSKGTQLGLGTVPAASQTLPGMGPASQRLAELVEGEDDDELYAMLFDEVDDQKTRDGQAPLEFEEENVEAGNFEDSGVVSTVELQQASENRDKAVAARHAIVAEHSRIQGADHYAVLLIDRDADADDIDAGYQIKLAMLEKKTQAVSDVGDKLKLEQIVDAYSTARIVLLDKQKRAAYDRELAGGELVAQPPSMNTELQFRVAEEMMAKAQWEQAVGTLKTVIASASGEADYHAALGWAVFNAGGAENNNDTALAALDHFNTALTINPDHPASHDYKGRVDAALRIDDAGAVFHLERALDLDPTRMDAVSTLESLLIARGELRRLERILKRLLFRLRGKGGPAEVSAWTRLAKLYIDHLDDPAAGAAAIANARKLAPKDPEIGALASRTEGRRPNATDPPRAGWREALSDASTGAALVNSTAAAGHADAAFLAASTMVALGTADDAMGALYDQNRVRGVRLPARPLSREQWSVLRHKDDAVELGALLELVAPAVHALAPMTLADSDLDPGQLVADAELPAVFGKLKQQVAELLGVGAATPVYAKSELGFQIHVVACDPPVLAAGDEALTAPERADLVFRLARAMTFLWPGRAVGASRPGRALKAIVLAIVREASGSELGIEEPMARAAEKAIRELDPTAHTQARASALRLLSRTGGGLNLSLWARSLSRTADRTGMLLCGDVPAAFAGAKDMGDLDKDLVEFAYSAAHVNLRAQLGLSRG